MVETRVKGTWSPNHPNISVFDVRFLSLKSILLRKHCPCLYVILCDLPLQAKLCKKFRVHGIPKLVLVDAENGKTITCEGYNRVTEDEGGLEFPWRRKKFTDIIKGKLLKQNKDVDAIEELTGKIVGLYFAANWVGITHNFPSIAFSSDERTKF